MDLICFRLKWDLITPTKAKQIGSFIVITRLPEGEVAISLNNISDSCNLI